VFQQAIDDAAAVWLYEQRTPVAIHRRFIVPPLRADGWWANLADWRTDPAQRLDRDRIGLGTPDGGAR
jgi:peptide/nickel transport system substrate-binding protein